jgi:hypothetical protein
MEAMRAAVAILRLGYFEKCVDLNFMEDFIGMLESEDDSVFEIAVGGIARILNRSAWNGWQEFCWIQFCEVDGIEVFERLSDSQNERIAARSTQFLKQIRALQKL